MWLKIYASLIISTDLGPQRCLLFGVCLQWSCLKAVSVPAFVSGGFRGSTATSALVLLRPGHDVGGIPAVRSCKKHGFLYFSEALSLPCMA